MQAFEHILPAQAKALRYVLHDIDDTITDEGKLRPEAYTALWQLHEAGLKVIPVTGRPAGWCDMILRQWPVDAVIGENGAMVYYLDRQQVKIFTHPSVAGTDIRAKLSAVAEAAIKAVPGCRISKDQFSRQYDLAIDFREDPPYLSFEDAQRIQAVCTGMGAVAKVSSIHVNAWFGNYDKRSMAQLFFQDVWGLKDLPEHAIFFGDSPNDEPMFERFPISCAVANIQPFVESLTHLPTYVTLQRGGKGFAEAVAHLLRLRNDK